MTYVCWTCKQESDDPAARRHLAAECPSGHALRPVRPAWLQYSASLVEMGLLFLFFDISGPVVASLGYRDLALGIVAIWMALSVGFVFVKWSEWQKVRSFDTASRVCLERFRASFVGGVMGLFLVWLAAYFRYLRA